MDASPWTEKYRPRVLSEVVGNEAVMARLKDIAAEGNVINLLLVGSPGIGKTTVANALANEMLGARLAKEAVLELNASDDRGIDVVRNKIKMFAQKRVTLPPGRHKLVILDEADSMTPAAQQALRRTMELYSGTTRFALAANFSSKVIEPIQSRCAVIRFRKLSDAEVARRLVEVLVRENVPYDQAGVETVVFTAEGDMRQALNNAQSTCNGFGMVSAENVLRVCDAPSPVRLRRFLEACERRELDAAVQQVDALWCDGYAPVDIVSTLFRIAKVYEMRAEGGERGNDLRLEFMREIGMCHARLADGVGSLVQLTALAARMVSKAAEIVAATTERPTPAA